MKTIILCFVFSFLLMSCSEKNKIEKINDVMWIEHIDIPIFTQDEGETIIKTLYFEINGMKYSIFLRFEQDYDKVEPVVIDIRGKYVNSNDNKELFVMRLENYFERFIKNEIIHKDIEYSTLFDKENNTLNYKLFQKNNDQNLVNYGEDDFPELTDWIIENIFKNDKEK